jgi:hypothetical protein
VQCCCNDRLYIEDNAGDATALCEDDRDENLFDKLCMQKRDMRVPSAYCWFSCNPGSRRGTRGLTLREWRDLAKLHSLIWLLRMGKHCKLWLLQYYHSNAS